MEGFKALLPKEDKPEEFPPCFSATVDQMPEIKDWELGKTYDVKVRMVSKTESVNEHEDSRAHFEVVTGSSKKKEDKTENDDNSSENDDEYDDNE